jgi:hypothetical protein
MILNIILLMLFNNFYILIRTNKRFNLLIPLDFHNASSSVSILKDRQTRERLQRSWIETYSNIRNRISLGILTNGDFEREFRVSWNDQRMFDITSSSSSFSFFLQRNNVFIIKSKNQLLIKINY